MVSLARKSCAALTAASKSYPTESSEGITPYTAVRTQAAFHIATCPIYARVISKPFPGAAELLDVMVGYDPEDPQTALGVGRAAAPWR